MCPISTRTFALRRSAEALALVALTTAAQAEGPRGSDAVEWFTPGLFCAPPEAGRAPAPGTISGWIHIPDRPITLVLRDTTRIPATLGLGFGVEFALAGDGTHDLTYTIEHPPMAPTGQTRQVWSNVVTAGQRGAIFYQFDVPEELLPGTWTVTATEGERILFQVPFSVVDAATMPPVEDLCIPADLFAISPSPRGAAG